MSGQKEAECPRRSPRINWDRPCCGGPLRRDKLFGKHSLRSLRRERLREAHRHAQAVYAGCKLGRHTSGNVLSCSGVSRTGPPKAGTATQHDARDGQFRPPCNTSASIAGSRPAHGIRQQANSCPPAAAMVISDFGRTRVRRHLVLPRGASGPAPQRAPLHTRATCPPW
jgi:hypothetical protein